MLKVLQLLTQFQKENIKTQNEQLAVLQKMVRLLLKKLDVFNFLCRSFSSFFFLILRSSFFRVMTQIYDSTLMSSSLCSS